MRGSQTFQKRQRELTRQEKQKAKAQRKMERKQEKQSPTDEHDFGSNPPMPDAPAEESTDEEPGT